MSSKSRRAHIRDIRAGRTIWLVMVIPQRIPGTKEFHRQVLGIERLTILEGPRKSEHSDSLFFKYRKDVNYGWSAAKWREDSHSVTDCGFRISGRAGRPCYNSHGVFTSLKAAQRYAKLMRETPVTFQERLRVQRHEEWERMMGSEFGADYYAEPDYHEHERDHEDA